MIFSPIYVANINIFRFFGAGRHGLRHGDGKTAGFLRGASRLRGDFGFGGYCGKKGIFLMELLNDFYFIGLHFNGGRGIIDQTWGLLPN